MKLIVMENILMVTFLKRQFNMAKDMTAREKLVFIISFVVFLHWGVNVSSLVINNLFYQ